MKLPLVITSVEDLEVATRLLTSSLKVAFDEKCLLKEMKGMVER